MAKSEGAASEAKKTRQPKPKGKTSPATPAKTAASGQQKTRKKKRPAKTASAKGQRPATKQQKSPASKTKGTAAKTQRPKQGAKTPTPKHATTRSQVSAKAASQTAAKSKTPPVGSKKKKKESQPLTLRRVAAYVLPVVSLAVAFVAVVLLYRRIMPQSSTDIATANAGQVIETTAPSTDVNTYLGVNDKWVPEGYFTTGNKDLDKQVKAFVEGKEASNKQC